MYAQPGGDSVINDAMRMRRDRLIIVIVVVVRRFRHRRSAFTYVMISVGDRIAVVVSPVRKCRSVRHSLCRCPNRSSPPA